MPQLGQILCGALGDAQLGHIDTAGFLRASCERRLPRLALDTFLFGTAIFICLQINYFQLATFNFERTAKGLSL